LRFVNDVQIGPFVDSAHPKIKSGDIEQLPTDLFHACFTEGLREFLDLSSDSLVLLVPSIRDVISQHLAFPQGELPFEFAGDPVRILQFSEWQKFSVCIMNSVSNCYQIHVDSL
jgi:DNA polymerase alpha/epsilon subunit B